MNSDSLSVLVVAPEVAPLAQTGGLGEVAGSLPLALKALGCDVAVCMPAYRCVLERLNGYDVLVEDLPVRLGPTHLSAEVLISELTPGIPLYLIRRDEFYDRSELYNGHQGEYFDNPERYIFFSRSIPPLCPSVGFTPDIILGNDWQAGLVMALLDLGALPKTAGIQAVHNQGYLGLVPPERTVNIGLPDRYYGMDGLEYYGQMSLLKAGIVYASAVTTVSPTYAREVQTPEGGHGLDGVMRAISHRLYGILNGVNYEVWNPETDENIRANYSASDLSGKSLCKTGLLDEFGLPSADDRPLLGMVSRLTAQKGVNILAESLEEIFAMNADVVILGSGDMHHENLITGLQSRFPEQLGLKLGYDAPLAHRIISGCDILLMPSMYEPCGLAQMYGLKYGTTPLVRSTGGLNDTVSDGGNEPENGTGFKFNSFQSRALVRAVKRAVEAFHNKDKWKAMMIRGMEQDFSWDRSAREYISVFEKALETRRNR